MSYNVEDPDYDEFEPAEEEPVRIKPSKRSKKRKKEHRHKHRRAKRSRHEELGPRPEAKVDLNKLESDILQLYDEAASTGNA